MTISDINKKRKVGDIQRVSDLSGIPIATIKSVLQEKRNPDTKRGREIVDWFKQYFAGLEQMKSV